MDLGEPGNRSNDAIGGAKEGGRPVVASLLERFRDHPEETRYEVRVELSWFGEEAEIFALVVFLCDGLLEIREGNTTGAARFLKMAKKLPMELQIVLCHRVVGSMRMSISGEQRELAFKQLARKLLH